MHFALVESLGVEWFYLFDVQGLESSNGQLWLDNWLHVKELKWTLIDAKET